MPVPGLTLERFDPARHRALLVPLTELLHQAYRPLANAGFRYSASHQGPEVTRKRLSRGEGWLAWMEGALVGTVSLDPGTPDNPCEYYRRPGVYHFGQYAVRSDLQRRGIGRALLEHLEARTLALGGTELALDTAEGASVLIQTYGRHGYAPVGQVQWQSTNYRSVVMAKRLA